MGLFGFQFEGLQGIAPKTVQPGAQLHQTFALERINPAHAFAAFVDEAGVLQDL